MDRGRRRTQAWMLKWLVVLIRSRVYKPREHRGEQVNEPVEQAANDAGEDSESDHDCGHLLAA